MKLLEALEKYGQVSYVESWELKDKKDVSPSHRVKVFEEQDIIKISPDFIDREELLKEIDKKIDFVISDEFKKRIYKEANILKLLEELTQKIKEMR